VPLVVPTIWTVTLGKAEPSTEDVTFPVICVLGHLIEKYQPQAGNSLVKASS
jgi:drug/metabolite transporter superfamily protein YnfA